jgi:hypothetical protein
MKYRVKCLNLRRMIWVGNLWYCDVHDVGVAVDVAWQRTRTQQWLMQQWELCFLWGPIRGSVFYGVGSQAINPRAMKSECDWLRMETDAVVNWWQGMPEECCIGTQAEEPLPALCRVLLKYCKGCTLWYSVTVHCNPINPVVNPIPRLRSLKSMTILHVEEPCVYAGHIVVKLRRLWWVAYN